VDNDQRTVTVVLSGLRVAVVQSCSGAVEGERRSPKYLVGERRSPK